MEIFQKIGSILGVFEYQGHSPKENLSLQAFEVIRNRQSFLVLAALRLRKLISTASDLKNYLGIPEASLKKTLQNLKATGLIDETKN